MTKKKGLLSHYPRTFLNQTLFCTASWFIFLLLFVKVGKECLDIDILGKICKPIFNKKSDFNQYFLGADEAEKSALLSYGGYLVVAIIILNIVSLLINRYLWKKDKYIENNGFYLHNKQIFIINSLIHIACAFLLVFSFVSSFTVILALLFISFNSWGGFPRWKKLRSPQTEIFFSWKNQYVRKITFYSLITVLLVPLVIGRFRSFYERTQTSSPSGLAKAFNDLLDTSPTFKKIIEMLVAPDFGFDLLHWFILFWFTKELIGEKWKEFSDFWTKVNNIKKTVNDFKNYYYYQESWAITNNTSIYLGDYSHLKNSPSFLRKNYLGGDLNIDKFAKKNYKVVKYIEFCEEQIKEPLKRNFLNCCLFNEFSSWEDCLRTRREIGTTRKQ